MKKFKPQHKKRAAQIYTITIPAPCEQGDAWQLSQNFRLWLKRHCTKKEYSAICVMGVSENDSEYIEVRIGYRGKKEAFIKDTYKAIGNKVNLPAISDTAKSPHIHMVLFSKPGEQLVKDIEEYFTYRKYKPFARRAFNTNVCAMLKYAMMQSMRTTTAFENVDRLPQEALHAFVQCAESVNLIMGGKKPVFFGLDLSREYHYADASILEEDNSYVFGELNLSPSEIAAKRYAELQALGINIKPSHTSQVFTTDSEESISSGASEDNTVPLASAPNDISTNIDEVFTKNCSIEQSQKCEKVSNIHNFHATEGLQDDCTGLGYNINYNNIYNKGSYRALYEDNQLRSPPIPQNVIDGLLCFLDTIFPYPDSS